MQLAPSTGRSRGEVSAQQASSRNRLLILRFVFAIYFLLIFEGVLRKYIFPEWGRLLFFIRDPLVLCTYMLAWRHRSGASRPYFLVGGLILTGISIPLVLIQYILASNAFDWMLAAYGWRNYFFYLPLAFVVAEYFQWQDAARLTRWTLWMAIPISVLVYVQFLSPASAPVNQGSGMGDEQLYVNGGVAFGIVRTYGTFTSAPGQAAFIVSSLAMLLAAWAASRSTRHVPLTVLIPATAAILTCLALSGGRGTVIAAGLVFCAALLAPVIAAGRKLRPGILLAPILLAALSAVVLPQLFPRSAEAFATRWETAGAAEKNLYGSGGVFARLGYELRSFAFLLGDTPLQGYQLGIGGNAATLLGARGAIRASDRQVGAAETDWGRHILELGPILGVLFIAFRVTFVAWLGIRSVQATRSSANPLPLLLFSFVGVLMFNGQVTGHGSLNGYAWLFSGILMSSFRILRNPVPRLQFLVRIKRATPAAAACG